MFHSSWTGGHWYCSLNDLRYSEQYIQLSELQWSPLNIRCVIFSLPTFIQNQMVPSRSAKKRIENVSTWNCAVWWEQIYKCKLVTGCDSYTLYLIGWNIDLALFLLIDLGIVRFWYQILKKIVKSVEIFTRTTKIHFHETVFNSFPVISWRQTDKSK
jgi:hypothetical protein